MSEPARGAALVAFDPSTLKDRVSDQIRSSFVELIPEDAWKQMVQREIDWFTKEEVRQTGYYQERTLPSPLVILIRSELERMFKERLASELAKPEAER